MGRELGETFTGKSRRVAKGCETGTRGKWGKPSKTEGGDAEMEVLTKGSSRSEMIRYDQNSVWFEPSA